MNYGTAAFTRCLPALKDEEQHVAVLMRYKHVFEMVDAVQVLVEAGVVNPAKIELRSAFETLLGIEYAVKADTTKAILFFYRPGEERSFWEWYRREIGARWRASDRA